MIIHSNGSKWAGQDPDSVDVLIDVLSKYPLDLERFACFGFVNFNDNGRSFFGNFLNISHVFRIDTENTIEDQEIADRLTNAIKDNIKRTLNHAHLHH